MHSFSEFDDYVQPFHEILKDVQNLSIQIRELQGGAEDHEQLTKQYYKKAWTLLAETLLNRPSGEVERHHMGMLQETLRMLAHLGSLGGTDYEDLMGIHRSIALRVRTPHKALEISVDMLSMLFRYNRALGEKQYSYSEIKKVLLMCLERLDTLEADDILRTQTLIKLESILDTQGVEPGLLAEAILRRAEEREAADPDALMQKARTLFALPGKQKQARQYFRKAINLLLHKGQDITLLMEEARILEVSTAAMNN